jgi:hypothetical protein
MALKTYKKIKPAHVVVAMSDGRVLEGMINIGFEERVSDFLNMADQSFVPLFNVNGSGDVIILNKSQIASVEPRVEGLEFVESPSREDLVRSR